MWLVASGLSSAPSMQAKRDEEQARQRRERELKWKKKPVVYSYTTPAAVANSPPRVHRIHFDDDEDGNDDDNEHQQGHPSEDAPGAEEIAAAAVGGNVGEGFDDGDEAEAAGEAGVDVVQAERDGIEEEPAQFTKK